MLLSASNALSASTAIVAGLLLLVAVQPPATEALIEDLLDIIDLGKEVTSSILHTWDMVNTNNELQIPFYKEREKKILSKLTELSRQMDYVESKSSSQVTWTIEKINEQIVTNTQLQLQLHDISMLIEWVLMQQNMMRVYAKNQHELERTTLQTYAEQMVSTNDNAIQGRLERIHGLLVGSADLKSIGSNGLLELIAENLEEAKNQVCSTRQSAQQVLYQLYTTIALTELRGYSMMQFSWMLLKSYGKGNYTKESELMRNAYEERSARTRTLLARVMERADRQVWRCDPSVHVEGQTYERLTRLMQGYLENEINLNEKGSCWDNCGHYSYAQSYGCREDRFCGKQTKCNGKVMNCRFIESDMSVCPSKQTGSRRYEYIEYKSGRTLGRKDASCTRGTTRVESWWVYLFWHCSFCMCQCDEESAKSDRYFSLRAAISDVAANRVVTGLRWRKLNRIVHLQVQEGELEARGAINSSSIQWQPIDDFRITDPNVKPTVDYHTLSWQKRAVDTDDLMAPANHVVTGVRLRTVGTHLNLELRITEADFETGKLREPSSWHSNDESIGRSPALLVRPDIPTRSLSKSVPVSESNQYIEFGPSDLDADLSQTTVPYLDSQEVVSIPPVALAGAGLFLKARDGYGGFLAPKLITYDFASHIEQPVMPEKK